MGLEPTAFSFGSREGTTVMRRITSGRFDPEVADGSQSARIDAGGVQPSNARAGESTARYVDVRHERRTPGIVRALSGRAVPFSEQSPIQMRPSFRRPCQLGAGRPIVESFVTTEQQCRDG